jgi:glucose/arabinose dehydrogenase
VRALAVVAAAAVVSAAAIGAPARSGAATSNISTSNIFTSRAATSSAPATSVPPGFSDTVAFKGLKVPTAIAFSPDGRVFVALKSGIVDVFSSLAATTPTVWANLSAQVDDYSDRGLLGLVVDPKLGTVGHNFVYVLFTLDAPPGGTAPVWNDKCPTPPGADVDGCVVTGELASIAVNADGTAGTTKPLIKGEWCQQFTSHSIGHLAFGPDGDLYVSSGEGANYVDKIDIGNWGGTLAHTPTPVNPCGDPPGGVGVADTSPTAEGGSLRAQTRAARRASRFCSAARCCA